MIRYWTGAVNQRYGTTLVIHRIGIAYSWAGGDRFNRETDVVTVDAPHDEVHEHEMHNFFSHDMCYRGSPYYVDPSTTHRGAS